MHLSVVLIFVLLFTLLISSLAKRIRVPDVVALIAGGLIMGLPFFRELAGPENVLIIGHIGDVGLITLMLLAGLETSYKELLHEEREALIISLSGALVPFLSGVLIFVLLGFDLVQALIVGVAMSITAEATTAALLLDLNRSRTKIGTLMMESGIIDDFFGFAVFLMVTFFLKAMNVQENILLSGAILAFFAGILLQIRLNREHIHLGRIKYAARHLIVPFFFVSMGLHFDLRSVFVAPMVLVIIVLVAFFGKFIGTYLARPFTSLTWKQTYLVAWAMNSRGAIELALALIARRAGLIPTDIYSSLVIMALLTTIAFPVVVSRIVKKHPKLMD